MPDSTMTRGIAVRIEDELAELLNPSQQIRSHYPTRTA